MGKMNDLTNNLVSGPDFIPNILIKKCIRSLSTQITKLLKESLNTDVVSTIWRMSFVRLVLKNGKQNEN